MSDFVAPSRTEIYDALRASVFYVLSDMPWSFEVTSRDGKVVKVWVSELPDTVTINVSVYEYDIAIYTSHRGAASRLMVSEQAPEIVIESASGSGIARLEISLTPRLLIRDHVD